DGRTFLTRILPYRTLENVIDGVVITFTDTTAAQAVETALAEEASVLRQMAESLPCLIWGSRADGYRDYASPQWVEYTGVPAAEQLGFEWLELVHPEDRERVREEWRKAVKSATDFDTEFRLRGASGTYRWFKSRRRPIRDSRGKVVKWYGATI